MKKFFLFKQSDIGTSSVRSSDTGLGLNVFVVSVDKMSFMTATEGEVQMVFDDATLYQETGLFTGEAIEKTAVAIACLPGDEVKLMDDVMKFMSSEKYTSRFMRFDGSSGGFASKYADSSKPQNVLPKVKANPINLQTGVRSFGDAAAVTANSIAGINFNYTKPLVDYNHEGLAGRSNGDEVASSSSDKWPNAGTGGASYDIVSNVSTPNCTDPASEDRGLSQKAVQFAEGEHFIVPSVKVDGPYTMYIVFSTQYTSSLYSGYFSCIYGDAAGETLGPGGRFVNDGAAAQIELNKRTFSFRHSTKLGSVASQTADSQIVQDKNDQGFDPCHVLIIRRDENNTIFVHDRSGIVIAQIDDVGGKPVINATASANEPDTTAGPLLIERLGTTADIVTNHFSKSVLARFGVIESDIGLNESVRLADDFFQFYSK